MTRILAITLLASAACFAPTTTESIDTDATTEAGSTTADADTTTTTDDPTTSAADTQIDPDTTESSTGPADCETARFDQSVFDGACFAP